jgi:hypothetical protein
LENYEMDLLIASKTFILRYLEESQKEKVNNSSLYAGSPMYYYCRGCTCLTEVLPESHWGAPKKFCDACKVLSDHGLLQPLRAAAEKWRREHPDEMPPTIAQNDQTLTLEDMCRKLLPE